MTGAALGAAVTAFGPYLVFRPNRVVAGTAASALEAFGAAGWGILCLWIAIGALALLPSRRMLGLVRGLLGTGIIALVLIESGAMAAEHAAAAGPIARTSFGWAFYVSLFALFLVQYAALQDTPSALGRAVIVLSGLAAPVAIAAAGGIAELGIVREFELARSTFARSLREHLFYALGSTGVAIAVGIPLGVWAARSARAEAPIMGALNLGQVFPALAFIGLMMPVLSALGNNIAILDRLGVGGIGWAPVFIVLVVYALFPVTRNTLVAIRQLDPGVLDAARGMGMGRWHSLAEVELPLAFPVVLAGIRIALVQGTAGAILAAFVGGGGLGTIMFFGLVQTSMDLVLVGVLPIFALALVFDSALRAVERFAGGSPVETDLA